MRFLAILAALLLSVSALAEASPRVDDGLIRVKLSSLGEVSRLEFSIDGCYALDGSADFRLADDTSAAIEAENGEVWLDANGLSVNLGDTATLTRHASGGIEIAGRLYCGDLTLSAQGDRLIPVLKIGVEDYLFGVVGYEMSDSFPLEALKAQAVAARTYAMQKKSASAGRSYDLVDTTDDQVFRGFNPDYKNVIAAVEATRGVVGTYAGEYAACYYTASNGGMIASPTEVWGGECGYIESKPDPYDLENPRSLVNEIRFKADLSDCAKLRSMLETKSGGEVGEVLSIEVDNKQVIFTLDSGTVSLDAYADIKDGLHLGLNRADTERVSVEATADGFSIQLRGFGHCAGMSQRGAQWMAGEYGMGWEEIIAFYYPGMTLERIGWSGPELERFGAVTASALNVREEPSVQAQIVGRLEEGQIVTILGGESWLSVQSGEAEGWVRAEYIDINK